MTRPRRRTLTFAAVALVSVALLTGCTATGQNEPPAPPATSSGGAQSPSATGSASTAAPATFQPDGSAADNLPFFESVINTVWAGDGKVQGRAYIDALVAGGFTDKKAMQLTPDQTTIGDPADTIQFSILWKGECLIGQVGPATGQPHAVVEPTLPEGGCLIGRTRPIDW